MKPKKTNDKKVKADKLEASKKAKANAIANNQTVQK